MKLRSGKYSISNSDQTEATNLTTQNTMNDNPNSLVVGLIAALQTDSVTEAIAKALSPHISLTVEETVTKSMVEVNKQLHKLNEENKQLKQQTQQLTNENEILKQRLSYLEEAVDAMDRSERCHNLIISGLPEESYAERATESGRTEGGAEAESQKSVEVSVMNFINKKMNIPVHLEQISVAYRLKKGKNDKYRPVFVQFLSRKVRNNILAAKKSLKGESIFVTEHLSKANLDVFHKVRLLKKRNLIHSFWTWNGRVYVKTSNDQSCKPLLVKSTADLPALADV